MHLTRPISIWGMTGVGKSTVAPLLAEQLGVDVVDLDAQIVAAAGCSIPEIWATEGEAGFRAREAAALDALYADPTPRVIALGGGALLAATRRARARRASHLVVLTARVATLAERLADATDRPLLGDPVADAPPVGAPTRALCRLYARRCAAYADADHTIATDGLDPPAVARAIITRLHGDTEVAA